MIEFCARLLASTILAFIIGAFAYVLFAIVAIFQGYNYIQIVVVIWIAIHTVSAGVALHYQP
jgi:hypothetical protein